MNWPSVKRVFPQVLVWTAVAALSGAMVLAQDMSAATASSQEAASRSDSQIEMDVVHALDASQALKNDLITAATIQSEVTLSGTVASDANRGLAESIAHQVQGVTKVNNNLKVVNPQDAQAAQDESNSQPDEGVPSQPNDQGQFRGQIHDDVQAQIQAQRQAQQQARAYATPNGPVTIPAGTLLQLRTSEPVNSKRAKDGQPVQFTVIRDVAIGNVLAIPRGATAHGVVTEIKRAGALEGSPELALTLTSLEMGGQSYPLDTSQFKVKGPGKGGRSANNMIGGTMMGTIIGCIAGRGVGCAIGAGAGLAAGTAASAATPGPGVWIPAEARVDFHLNTPLTVNPVSAKEAARMAQGLYQGGPNLYRRGYYPYGRPYPYAYGYPYGYPPVYYRPYYAVGGYYYWR